MDWQAISEYQHVDWDYGPSVLLAWREPDGKWGYGMGCSFSHADDDAPGGFDRSFFSRGWDVEPVYFAVITPPTGD